MAEIVPEMETMIGISLERILADAGHRSQNAAL